MTISIVFDGSNISQAETESDSGIWDKWGATQSPTQDGEMTVQNTYAMSSKVSNTTGGVDFDATASADLETTPKAVIARIITITPGGIDNTVAEGMSYQIGSGAGAYYNYYLFGLYKDYPLTQSWLSLVIDPNVVAYRDATVGSPSLTTANYYGLYIDMAGSAKAENVAHDTLNYFDIGTGLTLTGNTPDGVFQDFIDFDEGTYTNRQGLVTTREGILYVLGVLTIGTATETDFTDSNKVIVFPDGLFDTGFCGLDIGIQHASSIITVNTCTFVGRGRSAIVQDFATTTDVDGTNDEIDITAHGFETGDYVAYSREGGSADIGPEPGNFWVRAITVDSISLYTTRQNSYSNTSKEVLTATGSETHRLTKQTETRPDFVVTGTSGSASLDGCAFLNHNVITFTSASSIDGGRLECKSLTQNSADISNVTIVTSSIPSVATLQDPTFGTTTDLHDVDFIQGGQGHAIELTTATSYTLTNIIFSGYGTTTSDDACLYLPAMSGAYTINISGGSTPTYRQASGSTATVAIVADPVSTTITVKSLITGNVISGAQVLVWVTDNTNFPYQATVSITGTGTTASVSHTGHGMANNDNILISGVTNDDRYNGAFTISNVATNSYDYTTESTIQATPATGTIWATFLFINDVTNGSGVATDSRVVGSNQPIVGRVRKSSTSPFYQQGTISDTVSSTTGFSVTLQLADDE